MYLHIYRKFAFITPKVCLTRSPITIIIGERARHYQGCTNLSWCGICVHICMEVRVDSACHAYVMWAELGHGHFLYVPAVSNVVTTGNGTDSKNV